MHFYCPSPIDSDITEIKMLFREAGECYVKPVLPFRTSVPTNLHENVGGSVHLIFSNYHLWLRFQTISQ